MPQRSTLVASPGHPLGLRETRTARPVLWRNGTLLAILGFLSLPILGAGALAAVEADRVIWDLDPTLPMPKYIPENALAELERTNPEIWEKLVVEATRQRGSRCGYTSARVEVGPPASNSKSLSEVLAQSDFVGTGVVHEISSGWGSAGPAIVAYVELSEGSFQPTATHPCTADTCRAVEGDLLAVKFNFGAVTVPRVGLVCVNYPNPSLAMPRVGEKLLFAGYLRRSSSSRPYADIRYWWAGASREDAAFAPQPFRAVQDRGPVSPLLVTEVFRARAQGARGEEQ